VLGVDQVGIHDNFFELGGDSLLVVRIVSQANKLGLGITTKQLFQHQTVADLAAVVGTVRLQAEQGLVTGPVPFSPAQRQFLQMDVPTLEYHSIGFLLEAQTAVDPALLAEVLAHLLQHHDSLRLRLTREHGEWTLVNAGPGSALPLRQVTAHTLTEEERAVRIDAVFDELQNSFNLAEGPLLQMALLDFGPQDPHHLLLAGHYLALDIISWHILLVDLDLAYQQRRDGKSISLPPKTTAFKQWTERLAEYAQSEAIRQELSYWLAEERRHPLPFPLDYPDGANTVASAQALSVRLGLEESHRLLRDVPKRYDIHLDELLLSALVQAYARWSSTRTLAIELIGHGREALFEDMDLSRTIGWLNTTFPIRLDLATATTAEEALRTVKSQLRAIPSKN
jgi:hypothetical protein